MIAPIMCCGGTAVRSECPYHKDVEPGTFQKAEAQRVLVEQADGDEPPVYVDVEAATRIMREKFPPPKPLAYDKSPFFKMLPKNGAFKDILRDTASGVILPISDASIGDTAVDASKLLSDDGFETRMNSYWAASAPVDITPRPAPDPTNTDPMQTMVFDVGQSVRLKAHPSDTGRIVSIDRMNCTLTIQPDSNLPFDTVKNHCSLWEPVADGAKSETVEWNEFRMGSVSQIYCEPPRSTGLAGLVASQLRDDVFSVDRVAWSTQGPIIHTFDSLSSHSSCHGLSPDESIVDYLMSHRHVTEMVFAADDYRCLCMAAGDAWGGPRYEVIQGGVNFAGPVGRVKIRPAAE